MTLQPAPDRSTRRVPACGGELRDGLGWGHPLRAARRWITLLGTSLVFPLVILLFVGQTYTVTSGSMLSTIHPGDRLLVQKIVPFTRGDVIVFRDNLGWADLSNARKGLGPLNDLAAVFGQDSEDGVHVVKRVIGVAGDHVVCCDARGRVSVNGVALDEASYLNTDPETGRTVDPSREAFDAFVPARTVFVMGDNRPSSADSRAHLEAEPAYAFVRTSSVVGTVVAVIAPFEHASRITGQAAFAAVPRGSSD